MSSSGKLSVLPICILFIIGGLVSVIGGIMSMVAFFKEPDTGADLTMGVIFKGVVLPHIFIFLGVGIMVYGIILAYKMFVISRRLKN